MAKNKNIPAKASESGAPAMDSFDELLAKFAALSPDERKKEIRAAGRVLERIAKLEKEKSK